MTLYLINLSQFVFLFLLASLLSLLLFIFSCYFVSSIRQKALNYYIRKYGYELKNYLLSESQLSSLKWLQTKGSIKRNLIEELLLYTMGSLQPISDITFERFNYLWQSLGYEEKSIKCIGSRNSAKQIRACLLLGLFRYDKAKTELRPLLQQSNQKLRWAAALALLSIKDEKSLRPILESVKGNQWFSLVQFQPDLYLLSKEGIFSLEEVLQHPEPEIRILALGIVGRLKQREFLRFVVRMIEDPILEVRMKALAALSALGLPKKTKQHEEKISREKKQQDSSQIENPSEELTASMKDLEEVLQ